jgi:hypothetical protein
MGSDTDWNVGSLHARVKHLHAWLFAEFGVLNGESHRRREAREEELKVFKRSQAAGAAARDAALGAASGGCGGACSDMGDRQPLFLRDKGAALFAQGNYK